MCPASVLISNLSDWRYFKERMSKMLANIIIMALILGYCAYIIYKSVKNTKEGKHMGCAGCSGNCGNCGGGCGGAAFNKSTAQSSKKRLK